MSEKQKVIYIATEDQDTYKEIEEMGKKEKRGIGFVICREWRKFNADKK